jgi:RNA polymerase sigma-70 factor (family 1)
MTDLELNSKSSERELLVQVSKDNKEAFTRIYYQYKDKLYWFSFGLTHSVEKSEDLVHDVFLKFWQNRKSAKGIENLNAYLFRMAQNQFIDAVRKFSRNVLIFTEQIHCNGETDNGTPAETLISKELREKLEAAVNILPPQQRKIFYLHREQGLPHAEIASQLNLSVSTTQNHINQAFANIRRYMLHAYPDVFVLVFTSLSFFK